MHYTELNSADVKLADHERAQVIRLSDIDTRTNALFLKNT